MLRLLKALRRYIGELVWISLLKCAARIGRKWVAIVVRISGSRGRSGGQIYYVAEDLYMAQTLSYERC